MNTVILDGAMGSLLQSRGLLGYGLPELLCIDSPEIITGIHKEYIESGAKIIYTDTFGANACKLKDSGKAPEEIIAAAVNCAKAAVCGRDVKIAVSCGPTGRLIAPLGEMSFDEAYDIFREVAVCAQRFGADIIAFETKKQNMANKRSLLCQIF